VHLVNFLNMPFAAPDNDGHVASRRAASDYCKSFGSTLAVEANITTQNIATLITMLSFFSLQRTAQYSLFCAFGSFFSTACRADLISAMMTISPGGKGSPTGSLTDTPTCGHAAPRTLGLGRGHTESL
jgi:hypothetical protein